MQVPASRFAESVLPTRAGPTRVIVFRDGDSEHVALVFGNPGPGSLCRVHSECLTGEVFGSLRCDCRAQLDLAMQRIADVGDGVIVYLRQEGRGIGLGNKIRAYALQDKGADTVAANESLGLPADPRNYGVAADMLRDLGVSSVRLMTNNPAKVAGLEAAGISVTERLSHWTDENPHNRAYLDTKRERMGHVVDDEPAIATTVKRSS